VQSRQDQLLVALRDPANRKASQIELARQLGWKLRDGKPHHVAVSRALKALEKAELVTGEPGSIELTKKGQKALNTLVQNTPDLNTECSDLNTSEHAETVQ
jgi:DNA-binding MarR family transcriptional regulator